MSTQIESDPDAPQVENAPSGEAPAGDSPSGEQPQFNWEYRTEFRINTQMREVVALTRKVVEGEIDRLRRKIEKLTYGS